MRMATVNFYLNEKEVLPEADLKKVETKAKGKTLKVTLQEKDMSGDKVKPTVDWAAILQDWIKGFGLSGAGLKLIQTKGKFDGKVAEGGDYTLFLTINRNRIKAELEVAVPVIKEKPKPKYKFLSSKLEALCSAKPILNKIESIALAGKTETGHGPVAYLKGALHAHVTNTLAIGWVWKGDEVVVVAIGKKNNQNKEQQRGGTGPKLKTAEYDWTDFLP
jgi:hypothetical protein